MVKKKCACRCCRLHSVWEDVGQTLQILRNVKRPHKLTCMREPTDHSTRTRLWQYTYSIRISVFETQWLIYTPNNTPSPLQHTHPDIIKLWPYTVWSTAAEAGLFNVYEHTFKQHLKDCSKIVIKAAKTELKLQVDRFNVCNGVTRLLE